MKRYGYWVMVGLLCLSTMACDQHTQIAAQNRLVEEAYGKGDDQQGLKLAEKTLHLAQQKLGSDHPGP